MIEYCNAVNNIISTYKDFISVSLAFITVLIALAALDVWKRQIKATFDTQLAREIILVIYAFAESVHNARQASWGGEERKAAAEAIGMNYTYGNHDEKNNFDLHIQIRRIDLARSQFQKLENLLNEAAFRWNMCLDKHISVLNEDLDIVAKNTLAVHHADKAWSKDFKIRKDILLVEDVALLTDKDEFSNDFKKHIQALRDAVWGHVCI